MEATTAPTTKLFEGLDDENRRALETLPRDVQERLDVFLRSIKEIKFLQPDGDPRKEWSVFREKTWDDAEEAARKAAKSSSARRYTASMLDQDAAVVAAWNWDRKRYKASIAAAAAADAATRSTALHAARVAAIVALGDVAKVIRSDAALYARYIVVSDLEFRDKGMHWQHVQDRWKVWKKGYGLHSEVDGTLYVYCQDDSAPTEDLLRT